MNNVLSIEFIAAILDQLNNYLIERNPNQIFNSLASCISSIVDVEVRFDMDTDCYVFPNEETKNLFLMYVIG